MSTPSRMKSSLAASARELLERNATPGTGPDRERTFTDGLRWLLSEAMQDISPVSPERDRMQPDSDGELNLSSGQLKGLSNDEVRSQLRQYTDSIRSLDLSGNDLTQLPEWVATLGNLEALSCNDGRLTDIPEGVAALPKLRRLSAAHNRLRTLPEVLVKAPLIDLFVEDNEIPEVPRWLAEMPTLRSLVIGTNPLSTIPDELGELTQLTLLDLSIKGDGFRLHELPEWIPRLTALERLRLGRHYLQRLPDNLAALTQLRELTLWANRFERIPPQAFHFPLLEKVDLAMNQVQAIPQQIGSLKNLETLALGTNRPISDVPESLASLPQLTALYLDGCSFETIPPVVMALPNLRSFSIGGSNFHTIPEGIARWQRLQYLNIAPHRLPGELASRLGSDTQRNAKEVRSYFRRQQRTRLAGKTICVIGEDNGSIVASEQERIAAVIGRALFETGCDLIMVEGDQMAAEIFRVFNDLWISSNQQASRPGPLEEVLLKDMRNRRTGIGLLLQNAVGLVVVGGGDQNKIIIDRARERGIPVLPFYWPGGAAAAVYDELFLALRGSNEQSQGDSRGEGSE